MSRAVAVFALAVSATYLTTLVVAARDRKRALVLAALVVLALVVHLVGIDHELAERYYGDEGTYIDNAGAINRGQVLRPTFVYPHLLYYLDAFVFWLASLAPKTLLAVTGPLYGVTDWPLLCRLLARIVSGVLAALTVVPVFRLADRVGGMAAGVFAGALITFAAPYNAGSHVHTADVPSAFFAALSFAAAGGLLRAESRRHYVWAGIFAGLAAGTKYPAGVVAIAIVALYLRWRLETRRFSLSLLWAGIPAIAVFLLTTPGLVLVDNAVTGSRGALFGLRQYSQGAWMGVVVDSNTAYYLDVLERSFAWPALVLGVAGIFLLRRERRAEVLWLLPFPVVYLLLLASMNVVVERNLYPVLPAAAVILGIGLGGVRDRLVGLAPERRTLAGAGLGALVLALPAFRVLAQDVGYARPSTRQLASRWMHQNLPPGSVVLKERYTPNLSRRVFKLVKTRFVGHHTVDELRRDGIDYVVLAGNAFGRFLRDELHFQPHHRTIAGNYRAVFEELEKVYEADPGRWRQGPQILVYRVD